MRAGSCKSHHEMTSSGLRATTRPLRDLPATIQHQATHQRRANEFDHVIQSQLGAVLRQRVRICKREECDQRRSQTHRLLRSATCRQRKYERQVLQGFRATPHRAKSRHLRLCHLVIPRSLRSCQSVWPPTAIRLLEGSPRRRLLLWSVGLLRARSRASANAGVENNLAHANGRWRNFDALVFAAELESLLHAHVPRRN
jgi:hypothetical protein